MRAAVWRTRCVCLFLLFITTTHQCQSATLGSTGPVNLFQLLLFTTQSHTQFSQCAFSHAGPAVWNSMLKHISADSNYADFKRSLKTYYFSLAFNVDISGFFYYLTPDSEMHLCSSPDRYTIDVLWWWQWWWITFNSLDMQTVKRKTDRSSGKDLLNSSWYFWTNSISRNQRYCLCLQQHVRHVFIQHGKYSRLVLHAVYSQACQFIAEIFSKICGPVKLEICAKNIRKICEKYAKYAAIACSL